MDEAPEQQPEPGKRRFGCCSVVALVIAAAVAAVFGGLFFFIYGAPFDGWTRADERRFRSVCTGRGGQSETFCNCMIDRFQARGIAFEEINPRNATGAGFLCGVSDQL